MSAEDGQFVPKDVATTEPAPDCFNMTNGNTSNGLSKEPRPPKIKTIIDPTSEKLVIDSIEKPIFQNLPPEHRRILQMRYQEHLAQPVVARELGNVTKQYISVLEKEALQSLLIGKPVVRRQAYKKPGLTGKLRIPR